MGWRTSGLRQSGRHYLLPSALRLIAGLALLVVAGTLALSLPQAATRPLSLAEAAFTATSALAVTGLATITPASDLTRFGQVILLSLIEIGGVGFMAGAVVILRLLGRKVYLSDRLALRDSLGLPEPRAILTVTWRVILTSAIIQVIGAMQLWLNWVDELGPATATFYALFHAASAFCNAGFELFTGASIPSPSFPTDGFSLTVIGSLIVLGGLGIPVVADLLTWPDRRKRLTLHTRVTLATYAALILIGGIGILIGEAGASLADTPPLRAIQLAAFQAISARTAGFAVLPSWEYLTEASRWLLMPLMFIGSAPASMGGGITTGTFAVMILSLWSYVRGLPDTRVGHRTLAAETVRRAGAVLTVSLLAVGAAAWLILITHRVPATLALFEVVSAFATTGMSLSFTGQLNLFGQLIIMAMMFWGRLGALTIVVALAKPRPPQPIFYPEETLLIG